ncbi:CCC motif membrane protein [Sungkyunkwania multivorans]|uniref:CCC motif membrane protein n=1 Tax=Sungkyunkwania multivorans TaxID=1173618 RepID=A0ABW3CT54_9FLAO
MEKQKLNPTLVYVLAILGLPLCCCLGVGVIPSAIAFFIAKGKLKQANENPDQFEGVKAMNTAKTIALVILIINILYIGWSIYRISTVGWDEIMEQQRQIMEQYGVE